LVFSLLELVILLLAACGSQLAASDVVKNDSQTVAQQNAPASTSAARASGSLSTDLKRVDKEGNLTIEVTPLNLKADGDTLDFKVVLNTHSVDLSFDLAAKAVLQDDQGRQVQATSWDGGRGGHHLDGTLSFPGRDSTGAALVGPNTRYLEVLIHGVADVPQRVFRWELQP